MSLTRLPWERYRLPDGSLDLDGLYLHLYRESPEQFPELSTSAAAFLHRTANIFPATSRQVATLALSIAAELSAG